nr:NYN domain-containing protein [Halomicronema sp. CCY15110]
MDLLYTRKFDGFCLVTSDSDFTGLAVRIREEGLTVLGFGEQKTPEAFRNACHKFIFTEVLRPTLEDGESGTDSQHRKASKHDKSTSHESNNEKGVFPTQFLLAALEESSDDEGWAELGAFGNYLNKLQPDFDSRLYGYKKLSLLVKAKQNLFVTEERDVAGGTHKALYVRAK